MQRSSTSPQQSVSSFQSSQAKQESNAKFRALQDSGYDAISPNGSEGDRTTVSDDGDHRTQNFIASEREIVVRERIALRDEEIAPLLNQSVGYKRLIAIAQDLFAGKKLLRALLANGKNISRPHRGEHTGSRDLQTDFSELAESFDRQITLGCLVNLSDPIHRITSFHPFTAYVAGLPVQ
ncbi:MAG: hypothetical protein P4K80_01970 [Acidobacteriaceae bacterium]|nr:hypothetical protein [Acidobacteriaceae bacterium]